MSLPSAGAPSVAGVASRAVMSTTASSVGARPVGGAIARELAAAKDDDGDGDGDGLNRVQRRKLEAQKRKGEKGEKGKRPSVR
ncbi:MAG: hypothetical protein A2138_14245 [Deltaproteobacteria bacterium RBG_16_71_12]|nr:MAG: hypothetical protein A2138_14245 [Deltaproteobacteria bacterium RBG_16_71_12]